MYKRQDLHRPLHPTLEEEPGAGLHHPLAGLAVDAAEGGIVRIGNDAAEDRMVEDVLRLETQLEVPRSVVAQVKLLQNAGVRVCLLYTSLRMPALPS